MLRKTIFGDACFDWKTWQVVDTGNEPHKVNVLLFFIILVAFCNLSLSAYAFDAVFLSSSLCAETTSDLFSIIYPLLDVVPRIWQVLIKSTSSEGIHKGMCELSLRR